MTELTLKEIAEAVSKQIPKKVVVQTTYYNELIAYDTYDTIETKKHLCPLCKTALFHIQKHCENCGQRLDWRDLV